MATTALAQCLVLAPGEEALPKPADGDVSALFSHDLWGHLDPTTVLLFPRKATET